ncbi:MAG TPA: hypothetical protein P5322_13220, partial [Spirochaetota bacterium]|nr:hypothetical protein [Spirochaetota bacterium]
MKIYKIFICLFIATLIISCQMTTLSNRDNLNEEEKNIISNIVSGVSPEIKENVRKVNIFKMDDTIIDKAKTEFNMNDSSVIEEYSSKII